MVEYFPEVEKTVRFDSRANEKVTYNNESLFARNFLYADSSLFDVFSVFTLLIAGMGLFGLAVFSVERRRKELSIRKTYGASVLNIVTLVSSELLKLVGIGFIISIPFAFYFGNKWLQQFVYRIELTPIHILASGLIALLIALITVGWYSFNVAKMNPADNLRAE